MKKSQLNRIKKSFENFPTIEWIEPHLIGCALKTEVLTNTILTVMDEHGFKLRHVTPCTLDTQYLFVLFEPKDGKK